MDQACDVQREWQGDIVCHESFTSEGIVGLAGSVVIC